MPCDKARGWCFTINNYTEADIERLRNLDLGQVQYLVAGRERGEQGTPHIQGYVWLKRQARLAGIKKLIGQAHFTMANGSAAQNTTYCTKEDAEPIILGELPAGQGARSDLAGAIEQLKDGGIKRVCEESPEVFVKYHRGLERLKQRLDLDSGRRGAVRAVWLYGATGVGKSWCARRVATSLGLTLYTKAPGKWWDNYDQQAMVLMDDYRHNHYAFSQLLQVLDQYAMQVEVKGAYVNLGANFYILTGCNPIHTEFQCEKDECLDQLKRRCLEYEVTAANREKVFEEIEQYFGEVMETTSLNGEESE